jgi:ATP-dependent DNA helicase RecQ
MLFDYLDGHPEIDVIVKSILRTYGGIFDQQVSINTKLIADKASTSENAVIQTLLQLKKEDIIALKLSKTDTQIILIEPREDDKTINRIAKTLEQQNNLKKSQVASVINYVNNDDICRSTQLLSYFGEVNLEKCGICSVCLKTKVSLNKQNVKQYFKEIVSVLKYTPMTSREIVTQTNIKEKEITTVLKLMLEENIIKITSSNTYEIL